MLPFIISSLVILHILFLHQRGSNNPLGSLVNQDKVPFYPYYIFKDLVGFILLVLILLFLVFLAPYSCGDSENFIPANPLSTPPHIQPEWYYLFAYAILRAIPNKLGGVIALALSVSLLYLLPVLENTKIRSHAFYMANKYLF